MQEKTKLNDIIQKTVHDYYSSPIRIQIPKTTHLSITKACSEFCTLDSRAFEIIKDTKSQNLAQKLFDADRSFDRSSI